jgi:hypothetical protein
MQREDHRVMLHWSTAGKGADGRNDLSHSGRETSRKFTLTWTRDKDRNKDFCSWRNENKTLFICNDVRDILDKVKYHTIRQTTSTVNSNLIPKRSKEMHLSADRIEGLIIILIS